MSRSNKSTPSGSQSSSQGFISRFWRQKLSNDNASLTGPAYQLPPTQPNYMLQQLGYPGVYDGQPLEPPRVLEFTMPESASVAYPVPEPISPAASPYASDPNPRPGQQQQDPYPEIYLFMDPPLQYPRPNPSPARPVELAQPPYGQGRASFPTSHGGTFPPIDIEDPHPFPSGYRPSISLGLEVFPGEEPASRSMPSGKGIAILAPPVSTIPLGASPGLSPTDGFFSGRKLDLAADPVPITAESTDGGPAYYDPTKPICSLNLVCYRSGAKGCELQQIQGILRSKCLSDESFEAAKATNKNLLSTDDQFFHEMARLYETKMCSFLRRHFSLKSLKAFRVLAYTPVTRPTVVPLDDFILQELMYAYQNPDKASSTSDDWIQWMFRLRRKDKRHALEFVEGWNTTRIAISGTVPWLSSCLVGIIWTAMGGDVQSAFTVASFILTSSSIILALLAIISSIESSGPIH